MSYLKIIGQIRCKVTQGGNPVNHLKFEHDSTKLLGIFGYKEQLLHSNKWILSVPKIH